MMVVVLVVVVLAFVAEVVLAVADVAYWRQRVMTSHCACFDV